MTSRLINNLIYHPAAEGDPAYPVFIIEGQKHFASVSLKGSFRRQSNSCKADYHCIPIDYTQIYTHKYPKKKSKKIH